MCIHVFSLHYHPLPPCPLIPPSLHSGSLMTGTPGARWQQPPGLWIPQGLHYDCLGYVKHLKCLIMPSAWLYFSAAAVWRMVLGDFPVFETFFSLSLRLTPYLEMQTASIKISCYRSGNTVTLKQSMIRWRQNLLIIMEKNSKRFIYFD